jgi:TRAP-type C4-dicarboxylate transport system permease small subunit
MTKWLDRVAVGLAVLAGACFVALALLICVDVANRNLKLLSIPWTVNVAEYLLYAMTFLGAPWVLLRGGHIVVDLLVQALRPAWSAVLQRVADLAGLLVNGLMLVYSVRALLHAHRAGTVVYKALVFPEWYLFVLAVLTFALLTLIFLARVLAPPPRHAARQLGL